MSDLFRLDGEVAVVIGGTGALGGAVAEALAGAGAKVAVCGRSTERGEARAKRCRELSGDGVFFSLDASNRESLKAARESIEQALGACSILVNAAGGNDPAVTVTPENRFEDISREAWLGNYDLNLVGGALLPCQEFGSRMCEQRRGSIINFASVSAHLPLSRVVAYSSAKSAVLNLSRFLAREWAPFGVRVNSLTPGFFPAEQNRRLLFNEDGSPTARTDSIWNHTPMRRFGEASELAGAAIFLASPKASGFVTGADIVIDGGFLCQTI